MQVALTYLLVFFIHRSTVNIRFWLFDRTKMQAYLILTIVCSGFAMKTFYRNYDWLVYAFISMAFL